MGRRLRTALTLVLLGAMALSACSRLMPGTGQASSGRLFSPVASPAVASGTRLGTQLFAVDFQCKLPVMRYDETSKRRVGGFISFPAGTYESDPRSLDIPGYYWDVGLVSYDRPFSKWIPTKTATPDGGRYAYVTSTGNPNGGVEDVHVVDVVTGLDRKIASYPQFPHSPYLLDFAAEGIYFTMARPGGEAPSIGLWLMHPVSGSSRQILSGGDVIEKDGRRVWTYSILQNLNLPAGPSPDTLSSVDLDSGARVQWVFNTGEWLQLWDVDTTGAPIVVRYSKQHPAELWVYKHPGRGTPIPANLVDFANISSYTAVDTHGYWVLRPDGLYLYQDGAIRKVSDVVAWPIGEPCA